MLKKTVYFDHAEENNQATKKIIVNWLKEEGFIIGSIGKPLQGCDLTHSIPEKCNSHIRVTQSNYKTLTYRGFLLWEICRGSLGYQSVDEIESFENKLPSKCKHTYQYAIRVFNTVEKLILDTPPAFFVVWGGMFITSQVIGKLASKHNIPCYATEFSFDKKKIYFDPNGVIGNRQGFVSQWHHLQNILLNKKEKKEIRRWVSKNYYGKASQPKPQISKQRKNKLISKSKPNILFLGQCYIDTVIGMDNPHFKTTMEAYKEVAQICEKRKYNLLLKLHPGDKPEVKKRIESELSEFKHTHILSSNANNNINVYLLMDLCDCGITINSQAGLEMLAKYKNVLTLGNAFYGNKGFNLSLSHINLLESSIETLVANTHLPEREKQRVDTFLFYFLNRYLVDRVTGKEKLFEIINRKNPIFALSSTNKSSTHSPKRKLNILIIHPSGRTSGSGFYLQELSKQLTLRGNSCMILSEGSTPKEGIEEGVTWHKLAFEGYLLSNRLKAITADFKPDVIYVVGIRTKPIRAAIEIHLTTGAKIALQSEDDDSLIFQQKYPDAHPDLLQLLDKETISHGDIVSFASKVNWKHSIKTLCEPEHDRWVEPILRSLIYKLSDLHTAIWYPMENKIKESFKKKTLVVPPVININEFNAAPMENLEREAIFKSIKIPYDAFVVFIPGTIYDFSKEFEIFAKALCILSERYRKKEFALVISGRSRVEASQIARSELKGKVYYRSMNNPNDERYFAMIKAASVIAVPGFNDEFNRLRLPSRIVKAMAFAKPIFTFKNGFGETLSDGKNAVLTESECAHDWASKMAILLDKKKARSIGKAGRLFCEKHFHSKKVAGDLEYAFMDICSDTPQKKKIYIPFMKIALSKTKKQIRIQQKWERKETDSRRARKLKKLVNTPELFFRDMTIFRRFQ